MLEFNGKPYIIFRDEMPPARVRWIKDRSTEAFSPKYADMIMSLDIETSHPDGIYDDGWIYSCQTNIFMEAHDRNGIRAYHSYLNLFRDEVDLYNFLNELSDHLGLVRGQKELVCYVHNLSFEAAWLYEDLKSFCGVHRALWTKPHKCLEIQLENGIKLRDSLAMTQKSLKSTCEDNRAIHGKVDGYDHTIIRYRDTPLSDLEQSYIEADVLGLCESMYNYIRDRGYTIASVPMTATGVNRKKAKQKLTGRGMPKSKNTDFSAMDADVAEWAKRLRRPFSLHEYELLRQAYHGGHTAGNIYRYGEVITSKVNRPIEHYDFASSYPAVLLLCKEYCSHMWRIPPVESWKLDKMDVAWLCRVEFIGIKIKPGVTMPCLPTSKLEGTGEDRKSWRQNNGKLLCADRCIHTCLHPDWECIRMCYEWDECHVLEMMIGQKEYLPKAFRDLIQESYETKSRLKGVEDDKSKIDYAISKGVLNSWYGMCVEQLVRDQWENTGCNIFERRPPEDMQAAFDKEKGNRTVRYLDGCICTALAKRNLYRMMQCCGWDNVLYCDTDSVFGWADPEKIAAYNEDIKAQIKQTGYGYAENKDGRPCYIGVIDREPDYHEFRYLHAKAYCGTTDKGFEMTLAGVPKKAGTKYLESIGGVRAFQEPLIFPADKIGKLAAVYFSHGVNLMPVDYKLSELPVLDRFFERNFDLEYSWQEQLYEE